MAWSATALSADAASYAALQADVGCFVGDHLLRDYAVTQTDAAWARWNTAGTSSGTNRNLTVQPYASRNAYDGAAHRYSQHNAAVSNATWFVNVALSGAAFDSVYLAGDNLLEGTSIVLAIADDSGFATRNQTIATWTVGGSYGVGTGALATRMAHCRLGYSGTAYSFSGVNYLRVRFNAAASWRPQLRELWLGSRTQPLAHPLTPIGDQALEGAADLALSRAGLLTARERFGQAAARDLRYMVDGSAEAAAWRALWERTGFGARSLLAIDAPYTAPVGRIVTLDSPALGLRWGDGPTRRDLSLRLRELPPFEAEG